MRVLLLIAVLAVSANAVAGCHRNQMALTDSNAKSVYSTQSSVHSAGQKQKPAEIGR
jgi:hypothetical protein